MRKLNEKQLQAVEHTEGPLLVIAGAGSGKTTVLVERIANIIENKGERPYKILAITFTNKAAGELKARLERQLGVMGGDVFAATFHSTCLFLLRKYSHLLGYDKSFTIYDTDDQLRLIRKIYKDNDIDKSFLPHRSALNRISGFKDKLLSPSDVSSSVDALILKIYNSYQKALRQASAFDFDDLIFFTVKLLMESDEVRDYCHNRFGYVLVDEYQDTSIAQFKLVSLLTGPHNNLCVVGDDDQSIYRFRGATIENILNFEKVYPGAEVIKLEQNYRSTANILDAANAVIENNTARKGKTLFTEAGEGEKLNFYSADDEYDEAQYVGSTISKLLNGGTSLADCAVLYRMNSQSGPIEAYCAKSGLPYKVVGGLKFFERKAVKDILSYLAIIANPVDNLRLMRILNVPARSIGATTADRISDIAASHDISCMEVIRNAKNYPVLVRPSAHLDKFYSMYSRLVESSENMMPSELCSAVIEQTGYKAMLMNPEGGIEKERREDDMEHLTQLVSMISDYERKQETGATISGFLEEVALFTDLDNYDDSSESLVMMTVHAAKGLEFENVFLVGLEDGMFPMEASRYNNEEMEEERRLCYVALTRAKKTLHISIAAKRFIFGQTKYNRASRFIAEIPQHLFAQPPTPTQIPSTGSDHDIYNVSSYTHPTVTNSLASSYKAQPIKPKKEAVIYNVGDRVKHSAFGEGVVISVKPLSGDSIVEVDFEKVGIKKTMANYAPMQTS